MAAMQAAVRIKNPGSATWGAQATVPMGLRVGGQPDDWSDVVLAVQMANSLTTAESPLTYGFDYTIQVRLGDLPPTNLFPGDANLDGRVTFEDFSILQNHYGQSEESWIEGDFTGDNKVAFDDFAILQNHYGQSAAGAASVSVADTVLATPCGLLGQVLLIAIGLGLLSLRSGH